MENDVARPGMTSSWLLYGKLIGLFVILLSMIVLNIGVWGMHYHPLEPVWYVPGADAARGQQLIGHYGCGACHQVPGIVGATGRVGPQLDQIRDQMYLAGILANTPGNLVKWIKDPKEVDPRTAMPDLDVSDQEARDMAEYLLRYSP